MQRAASASRVAWSTDQNWSAALEQRTQMSCATGERTDLVRACARADRPPYRTGLAAGMTVLAVLGLAMLSSPSAAAPQSCLLDAGIPGSAVGTLDLACGSNAAASGTASEPATAIGQFAMAGPGSTSVGTFAGSHLFGGAVAGVTSVGTYANFDLNPAGQYSTAIGAGTSTANGAHSAGNYSVAIGGGDGVGGASAQSTGDKSIAIGLSSSAGGLSSTAVGNGATASADNATAIGTGATAGFVNSTAVGNGATASAANQVAIGTASNTYRLAGVSSAASLAAQSGPVSFVTTDAAGNLATSSLNPANITSLQSQVTSLQSQVMDNRLEARSGTAVALAAGSMPSLQPGRKFALSAGYGNFEGANAFAIGATALLYDGKNYAIFANAGGGIGLERSVAGGRGAVSIQW